MTDSDIVGQRSTQVATVATRLLVAGLWISNVGWKVPPDFAALERSFQRGVDQPTIGAFSWGIENVALPAITLVGWATLLTEMALGAFLLVGLFTRFWALVGAGSSLIIGLTVAHVDHEWGWSYWMMIAAHLSLFALAAGRTAGLDETIQQWTQGRSGLPARFMRWAS